MFVSDRTGAGKSLTLDYVAPHSCLNCLNGENNCNSNTDVLMHVVPLISFMEDQGFLNLNFHGISVSYVGD